MKNSELIKKARELIKPKVVSDGVSLGEVGSALVTKTGNVYRGVSIHACCGVGFCAEHSAIAAMVTNGEYEIQKIVAVSHKGMILPPCGRCRELIYQINENNYATEIVLDEDKIVKLSDLLPEPWQKKLG